MSSVFVLRLGASSDSYSCTLSKGGFQRDAGRFPGALEGFKQVYRFIVFISMQQPLI